MRIIVYTKKDCKFCVLAKGLLDRGGVDYDEISLDDHDNRMAFIEKYPAVRGVPYVVLVNGKGLFYHEIEACWKLYTDTKTESTFFIDTLHALSH